MSNIEWQEVLRLARSWSAAKETAMAAHSWGLLKTALAGHVRIAHERENALLEAVVDYAVAHLGAVKPKPRRKRGGK